MWVAGTQSLEPFMLLPEVLAVRGQHWDQFHTLQSEMQASHPLDPMPSPGFLLGEMWDDLWCGRLNEFFWRTHGKFFLLFPANNISTRAHSVSSTCYLFPEQEALSRLRSLPPFQPLWLIEKHRMGCGDNVMDIGLSYPTRDILNAWNWWRETIWCFVFPLGKEKSRKKCLSITE